MANTTRRDVTVRSASTDAHPRILGSLSTGLSILDLFTEASPELGTTQLARDLKLSKAGAHRLLVTLLAHGYVRRNPATGRYRLGLKAWEVGRRALALVKLTAMAHEWLVKLAAETGETAALAVLDGAELLYVDSVHGHYPIQVQTFIGRAPVYATASGKSILAERHNAEGILAEAAARRPAAWPAIDYERLQAELELVRRDGYAVNRGEFRADVHGVAAALREISGETMAAISLSAPASRVDSDRLMGLSKHVAAAAEELERQRGYIGR